MHHLLWILCNIYGYLFGRRFLAPLHKVVTHASLHALGYGNMLRAAWSGEDWFVSHVLAPLHPKVCLDIGANVGAYTELLLRYTSAAIYAIDPLPGSYASLSGMGSRVIAIQAAVSDFDGEAPFFSRSDIDEKASLDERVRSGSKKMVRVMTLQTLVKEQGIDRVDFVKIDTEGFEREVLRTLGEMRPTCIQFEFNIHHLYRNCTLYEITQFLKDYDLYRLLPNGWLKIDPRKYVDNIFIFCNIVAVDKRLVAGRV